MKSAGKDRHILIVPSWYFDDGPQGIFIYEHARMLEKHGHLVGIIYVRNRNIFYRPQLQFENHGNIRIGILERYTLPKVSRAIWFWKQQYLRIYRDYCATYSTPDIIHAHGYLAGVAANYISKQAAIPYIITEHSTAIPDNCVPWYHARELRSAYAGASALVAVSEFLKKAMTGWLEMPKEIQVVGNPVDFSKFPIKGLRSENHEVRLISIGSLEPRKNYQLLLHALSLIKGKSPIQLVLVGTGAEHDRLEDMLRRLDLETVVNILGHIPFRELTEQLTRADFFVSSSISENFGVSIVEALACGVPVIATRSGGPEEYLNEKISRLASAHTPDALSDAIYQGIVQKTEFDPRLIRCEVQKKFDFPVIAPQVERIYDAVLNATIIHQDL